MFLTSVPQLYAWLTTPKGLVYMGYVVGAPDQAVHTAWMREAQLGMVLFDDPFTTDPQRPHFFHVYYLLLGTAARVFHLPLMFVEQAGRLLSGWAFLLVVYAFAAQLTGVVSARRLALAMVALTSGLGWLVNLPLFVGHPTSALGYWSMDWVPRKAGLVMPEAITFQSLMRFDLSAVSYLLLTLTFYLLWLAWRHGSWKLAVGAGLAVMLLGNVHSYDAITVWGVGGLALVVRGIGQRRWPLRELALLAIVLALSALSVAYQYHVYTTSEVFRAKADTLTLSPPFVSVGGHTLTDYLGVMLRYALTFGICTPLALVGVWKAARRRDLGWLYLSTWALVPFALVLLPFSFQRKVAEAMHVPLAMMAGLVIAEVVFGERAGRSKLSPLVRYAILAGVFALGLPSNLAIFRHAFKVSRDYAAGRGDPAWPSFYLRVGEVQAMRWLGGHTRREEAVLCLSDTGIYIPRVAGNHTYLAHWAETIQFDAKDLQVRRFLGAVAPSMTEAEQLAFARQNQLAYFFYGPNERAVATISPDRLPFLKLAYRNTEVSLYRFLW